MPWTSEVDDPWHVVQGVRSSLVSGQEARGACTKQNPIFRVWNFVEPWIHGRTHDKTSYDGLGRLAGRRARITGGGDSGRFWAAILGGDSEMGRAAAIAYARGADTAINYHPAKNRTLVKCRGPDGHRRSGSVLPKAGKRGGAKVSGVDIVVRNAGRQPSDPGYNQRISTLR